MPGGIGISPRALHIPLMCLRDIAGIRRIGRRPDQQQQQQQQGEGKPIDRRPERRPPRERRFEKPAEDKGEGGEFSVDK